VSSLAAAVLPIVAFASVISNSKIIPDFTSINFMSNTMLPDCEPASNVSDSQRALGTIIGWISAVVYLTSRLPQIWKNYKRKSVEGLSVLMFFCAVMGNTTYGLGVLLKNPHWNAINKALPWLVGSLGTLTLDFCILLQFWYYNDETPVSGTSMEPLMTVNEEDDDEDRQYTGAFDRSPARGLFGISDWSNSPFFKPGKNKLYPPPLDLRNTHSLGIIPSNHENQALLDNNRERSGSH